MGKLIEIATFPGWIVAVCDRSGDYSGNSSRKGYRCWVVTPELKVLDDGETYASSEAAMAAGRYLVELSLELEFGNDGNAG
ncbi:MAG: hypothetical protein AAGF66_05640 [Cyanobacteria bacterium P01_H01_bin.119]